MLIDLTKIIIWPSLILILCVLFRDAISSLIRPDPGHNIKINVGTQGLVIERAVAAAATVAAGTAARAGNNASIDQKQLASNLTKGIKASIIGQKKSDWNRTVLWVDDVPSNNEWLISVFGDLNISVKLAKSTAEAAEMLNKENFDILISDMSRPLDDEAGLEILKIARALNKSIPVAIYAGYWANKHRNEERRFDADLITDDPSALYAFVLSKLRSGG